MGLPAIPETHSRSDRALAETLLSFMEWGQGIITLEDALLRTVECFGATSGAIVRIRLKTLASRPVAVAASSKNDRSAGSFLAGKVIGENAKVLKVGIPFLMSSLEDSWGLHSPENEVWKKRKTGAGDLGFACVSRGTCDADFLELHFSDHSNTRWEREAGWYTAALARIFEVRRPGLITEALTRKSSDANPRSKDHMTILGANNPAGLTRTEFKVCVLLSRGLTVKVVVSEMGVSIATVRSHLRNIYAKTGVSGVHELALRLVSSEERNALRWPERISA
jgi:DNA-binding CsgD family transcriptional regulator